MNTNIKFYSSCNQITSNKKKAMSSSLSTGNFPLISTNYSKPLNIKTIKITDMYKNLYHKDTGKAIHSILQKRDFSKNEELEITKKNLENSKKINEPLNPYPIKKVKSEIIKYEIEPLNNTSPKFKMETKKSLVQLTNNLIKKLDSKGEGSNETKSNLLNNDKNEQTNKKGCLDSKKYYCPFCEHCNNIKDEYLENYFHTIRESKNIINRGFDFIIHSNLLSNTDVFKDINKTDGTGLVNASKFEDLINSYPKSINTNRFSYQILAHFLEALLEDKTTLENVASPDIVEKFKTSLISKGQAYDEFSDKLELDKELESLFDENTKKILDRLIKKKLLNTDFSTENRLSINDSSKLIRKTTTTIFEDLRKNSRLKKTDLNVDEDTYSINKKFLVLFLIFIQILSEISVECKERAVLLYKFFKIYFVEQEKKWTLEIERSREKIKYYKELCKAVIQQKNKFLEKVENINNILFSNNVTPENLRQHKKLIQDLLNIVNEKREEIYLLKSNIEILEKEIRLWIYDFDTLKISKDLKNRLISMNTQKIAQNINDEIAHKTVTKEEKSVLINADRFLMISGQRDYFYEQKIFFKQEVDRLNSMFKKNYYKKIKWKTKYNELNNEFNITKNRLEKELETYRDKLMSEKISESTQTELDTYGFNKMLKNHESVKYSNIMNRNKLTDFIERIKYGCSKNQPIAKKSLLYLIPEIYNEKIDMDNRAEIENKRKMEIEDFLYEFMWDKFKLKKIVKKHCEETIISILKYCHEDSRIDLIRRFLGLTDDRIRREILDLYLVLLKALPVSYFKLFEEDYLTYMMTTDYAFEIYNSKFEMYNFILENKDNIIKHSYAYQNDKEIKLNDDKKFDYFLLSKLYNKSFVFINELITKYKDGKINDISVEVIYDQFHIINREFKISIEQFYLLLQRVFKTSENTIDLETFFNFFNKKWSFKLKIVDYIDITLNNIISLYSLLEKKILTFFDTSDARRQGIIFMKEFIEIMSKILLNDDNKWKISDYFKQAVSGSDKEFITRDEFLTFCLNRRDVLTTFLRLVNQ